MGASNGKMLLSATLFIAYDKSAYDTTGQWLSELPKNESVEKGR